MSRTQLPRIIPVVLLTATALALSMSPAGAEMPPRVRGVVTAIGSGTVTLDGRDGSGPVTLSTGDETAYAYVVPADLDDIEVQDFVGTAVKGPQTAMVAVELAIIPEDMRAGRISFYGWDPLPDPTSAQTGVVATNMINGSVSGFPPTKGALAPTDTTNGTVSAETGSAAERVLTVTYDGGAESFRITVPRKAPIVRYVLADRSALAVGSNVMVKVGPGGQADLVTIGRGVTPPM